MRRCASLLYSSARPLRRQRRRRRPPCPPAPAPPHAAVAAAQRLSSSAETTAETTAAGPLDGLLARLCLSGSSNSELLAGVPTRRLAVATSIFKMCGNAAFVSAVISALHGLADAPALGAPARAFVRRTVLPHFCAGERLADVVRVRDFYLGAGGVRLLVDESVEERAAPEDWADNLKRKKALLRHCRSTLGDGVRFVPVKATALMSPVMLERMTEIIVGGGGGGLASYLDSEVDPRPHMSSDELSLLESALGHMSELCAVAGELGLPLLLDAEQSDRQPAIDFICRRLQQQFNVQCNDGIVNNNTDGNVIYNTYQMYMVGAEHRLARDLAHAQRAQYGLAAKIVRGAYLVTEAERAVALDVPCAVLPSKAETDGAYDRGVALLLDSVAQGDPTSCVVATHNAGSVERAVARMGALGLANDHASVHFAQIMGMCDLLTLALGKGGYNSHKLVLFGEFRELFPWLLRRLDENRDILGGAQKEVPLLEQEIGRRMRNAKLVKTLLSGRVRGGGS